MAQTEKPELRSDDETLGIKRDRVDSDEFYSDSPDSKRARLDSAVSEPHESRSENIVREDFLEMLEEEIDVEPEIQGLESVIRSLEREINPPAPAELMDETILLSKPDPIELGYLLEASDDELGLPPTRSTADGAGSEIDPSPIDSQAADLAGVNDSLRNEISGGENHAGDLLTIDGLFEYGGYVDDEPELQCWPESMPAL